jgi:Protein of unknown function C-terminus (DUF2451)/Vacuolar-sorting protein 54, of GARP complex
MVADALPAEYYDEKYDGARSVLTDIPLSNAELHVFLERTQAKQQKLLDAVSGKLSKEVMKNYESFIAGMRQISEIDMDISRAGIHVSNSLRKLGNAKEVLILGTLGIAYRRRKRERLAMVKTQLTWLRSLHQLEGTINTACASQRYAEAVGFIVDAQNKVRDPTASVSSINVLAALKPKVEGGLESLRGRVDRALEGLLTTFDSAHYGAALLGYRELDQYGVRSTAAAQATNAASNAIAGASSGAAGAGAGGGGRGRAGTTSAFDEDLGGAARMPGASLLAEVSSNASMHLPGAGGPGSSTALIATTGGGGGGGGSSIAAAATASIANQSLVEALPMLGSPDSNLAALPAAIQAAAVRAMKGLTKDAVIDHLLQDVRKRVQEEERQAKEKERETRLMLQEGALGLETPAAEEGNAASSSTDDNKKDGSKKTLSAADEYALRRKDLKQRPFSDLCSSIPADEIPQACLACAAACLSVLHSHYLLLQWHRLPYDPRNNGTSGSAATNAGAGADDGDQAVSSSSEECGFLHRNSADDEEDEAAAELESSSSIPAIKAYRQAAKQAASRPSGQPTVQGIRPTAIAEPTTFIELLKALRPHLLKGRNAIWQHVQQRFATLLLSAVGTAGVNLPLERLAQALIVSRDFMVVGCEYVGVGPSMAAAAAGGAVAAGGGDGKKGSPAAASSSPAASGASAAAVAGVVDSDPCNTLRSSLRLLCSQFMDSVHSDTFDKLKTMLTKETWLGIPSFSEQAMVGVMQSTLSGGLGSSSSSSSGASSGAGAVPSSSSTSLFKRFNSNKAAYSAISAAIKGEDLTALLQAAGGAGASTTSSSTSSSSTKLAAAVLAFQRAYSDGASVFACWIDRGNPFGFVKIAAKTPTGALPKDPTPFNIAGGLTVLATPRLELVTGKDDEDDDDEDEDDFEEDSDEHHSGPEDEESKKKRAAAKAKKASLAAAKRVAAQQRRAAARHLRRVHGDNYLLEIGLGRGPTLGFSSLLVNPHTADSDAAAAGALAVSGGGNAAAVSKKRLPGGESGAAGADDEEEDAEDDEDEDDFIEHSGDTSSEDEETDDDSADGFSDDEEDDGEEGSGARRAAKGGRRAAGKPSGGKHRRRGRMGDGSSHISVGASVAEVIQASFGSAAAASASGAPAVGAGGQHVVTTSALSGFARAVGRYLMLMEVLPTVGYLYTVATIFTRGPALRQVFNVLPPQPKAVEAEHNPNMFQYLDGSTLTLVARIAALACEARAIANKQAGYSSSSSSSMRNTGRGGAGGAVSSSSAARGANGVASSSSSASSILGAGADRSSEFESVTLYGSTVFVKGLPAMAQAQGLSSDYYTAAGAGAAQGQVLGGDAYNNEGVFVLLRRALQLIGAELLGLTGRGGMASRSGTSVLAEGQLNQDNPSSFPNPGFSPDFFVRPATPLELDDAGNAYGACERSVAVESLDFLLDVLQRIRPRIETHLPPAAMPRVNAFYTRSVLVVSQLRAVIYSALVPKFLPEAGALPAYITAVKWENIKEAMEPNPYVSQLSTNLVAAAGQLNAKVKAGSLPPASRLCIWGCIVSHLMDKFADGVSRVKKCTVPGRGLMSLDVGHLYSVAMKQVPIPPQGVLPRDKSYVDAYISAYYYDSEGDVMQWISKNRGAYPLRMVKAIITNGIGASAFGSSTTAVVGSMMQLKVGGTKGGRPQQQLKEVLQAIDSMYLLASAASSYHDNDGGGDASGSGGSGFMGAMSTMGMGMGFTGGGSSSGSSSGASSEASSKRSMGMGMGMGSLMSSSSSLASGLMSSMASTMNITGVGHKSSGGDGSGGGR